MLSIEVLQQIVANSELGQEWINDPLMSQDVWAFTDLGYSEEDCTINNKRNLYFNDISLKLFITFYLDDALKIYL